MPLAILFHFFYAQHVSDINTSIIRSLRLLYCITTLVVCSCFDMCWSFGVAGWGWYPCGRLKLCFSLPHGYHPNQPHRNVVWKQTEGVSATHWPIWRQNCASGTNCYGRRPLDCETDSCQCRHIRWICGHHLAWRLENAKSFCEMGSANADRWKRGFTRRNVSCNVITWQGYE